MINLYTKYEVSIYSRYYDVKAVQNVKNGVVWGAKGSLKVIGNLTFDKAHTTSYSTLL